MPVEGDEKFHRFSLSVPNDYDEPLFDYHRLESVSGEYAVVRDDTMVKKPLDSLTTGHYERSQSFVQPATSLKLLLAQIKETMVTEISSESIWYDMLCYFKSQKVHVQYLYQSCFVGVDAFLYFTMYFHYNFINLFLNSTIKELGYGEFGLVTLATWTDDDASKEVAVKTLNKQASQKDKIKFFQEAALMAQFLHDNVIRLYGMVTTHPVMIVLEFAKKGDLREYLISLQPE